MPFCSFKGCPDGLLAELLEEVNEAWAFSALTLAHSVVRVVVAQQVYCGFSIVHELPYRRAAR